MGWNGSDQVPEPVIYRGPEADAEPALDAEETGAGGPPSDWADRVVTRLPIAIGGALVTLWIMALATSWSAGLRGSTMEQLAQDTKDGVVTSYFVADRLDSNRGSFFATTQPGGLKGNENLGGDPPEVATEVTHPPTEVGGIPPAAQLSGGIVVWKTFSRQWQAASPGTDMRQVGDSFTASASPETAAAAEALDRAHVHRVGWMEPVRGWGAGWALGILWALSFLFVIFGPAPRVGNRWFWFWMIQLPLGMGMLAFAVVERIGLGRRMDRGLDRRHRGIIGFVAMFVGGIVFGMAANQVRRWGWNWPL